MSMYQSISQGIGPPSMMHRAGLSPLLAGGQRAEQANMIVAALTIVLAEQELLYGHGEQPPVPVQSQPYGGPPLRYLVSGRQVKFCTDKEQVLHEYEAVPGHDYSPVPEYAAFVLGGPLGGGIVRARVNRTGVSCCT